ncbi:MAG: hypothetical protein U0Y68_25600 [Blastocatellia bacterium]
MKFCLSSFFLTALLGCFSSSLLLAQSQPSASSQIAISATTGKEAVCEGGGEIIPSGQQTFARKRYVAATPKAKLKTTRTRLRK